MRPLHTNEASRVRYGLPYDLFDMGMHPTKKLPLALADGYENDESSAAFNPIRFMLQEGVTESEHIWLRQAFVADYQRLNSEPELADDMAAVMNFGERHHRLRQPVYDMVQSQACHAIVFTPRIELLLRNGERDVVVGEVDALIEANKLSTQAAIHVSSRNPTMPLGTVATEIGSILQSLPQFTAANYVEQRGSYDVPAWRNLERLTDEHHSMIELANRIERLKMTQGVIDTDSDHTIVFEQLRQLRFEQARQTPLNLVLGNRAVALTGRNGAGKTFAAEAIVEAMLTTASVGYASGLVLTPPVESIDMLVRPAGGSGDFSAFGVEVQQWAKLLKRLEAPRGENGVKVVVSDEPFSSTDTEGQAGLVYRHSPPNATGKAPNMEKT